MTISTRLAQIYSSPEDEILLDTIEIDVPGVGTPLRFVGSVDDHKLGVDGVLVNFKGVAIKVNKPQMDNKGTQTITFGFPQAVEIAEPYIRETIEAATPSTLTYRQYILGSPEEPCITPIKLSIVGGRISKGDVFFEATYLDVLNLAWPRDRYTLEKVPGIKYL